MAEYMNKLFSIKEEGNHIIYKILGIKISKFNKNYYKNETLTSRIHQNNYDLEPLKNAKKIILFLIPNNCKINGGIMSIFSLCKTSRELNPDSFCYLSTIPGNITYAKNEAFLNEENIYRFEQLFDIAQNVEDLIIHIPEYLSDKFYKTLTKEQIKFLKSIKNLQINILNQNIELMPSPKKIKSLFKLTDNITQTMAHNRYATQEICNKWGIPTHLFSTHLDYNAYKKYSLEEKEKIIVLSPDNNEYKEKIVNKLKTELPDWELITVNNMTFTEYIDLISRSYFTISFGEGFDGYFNQPRRFNSIGISVYNNNFFPNEDWKELENCFESYSDLEKNIVPFIKEVYNDKYKFMNIIEKHKNGIDKLYKYENFLDNLKRFYKKEYDFYPN